MAGSAKGWHPKRSVHFGRVAYAVALTTGWFALQVYVFTPEDCAPTQGFLRDVGQRLLAFNPKIVLGIPVLIFMHYPMFYDMIAWMNYQMGQDDQFYEAKLSPEIPQNWRDGQVVGWQKYSYYLIVTLFSALFAALWIQC